MLIGLTGDTHGSYTALENIAKKNLHVEHWLHTGDFYADAKILQQLTNTPVDAVLGNNDFDPNPFDMEKIFKFAGQTIWLIHGHMHGTNLLDKAKEKSADVVVYGHTHTPAISWHENILFVNPGSPAYPRSGSKPSFAVLELFQGILPEVRLYKI